ncbi:5-(carboxyamino)imidazole ribonucleotide synthase [Rhodocaloribacter litoris]|uniref:5-(carboxyamino)imidazole ribonucleotide synthase n=1 Tax=Rhodocaloribacter litoris TaxID=2558931 RepID=UPI0014210822|nr:5-(carboxyamino)imidazole ribonucleotide synthase [Rhodocaloribacter litoris]QXD14700.1 5-(carboxyamino)imidazole ribonucleotide synthase [Rhodocaloribacter litoris]
MAAPFPTLGILGDGQLGRMTALAALRMGLRVRCLAPKPSGPMDGLGEVIYDDWTDPDVLRAFAAACTVVTVESEWAPAEHLSPVLPEGVALWPDPATLHLIRDKGIQKTTLAEQGLPVPDFALCATLDEARAAAARFSYPVVLKRRRGSYDGYGNATAHDDAGLAAAWDRLAEADGLLVERHLAFVRELSVLVARRPDGEHVVYPVALTEQKDHRCHAVVVPAGIATEVEAEARRIALRAVEAVRGVGLTAVELFELPEGRILINELAPRPHNTGHYSIEACHTSQFENHVRAVLGWPLGDPSLRVPCAVMVNVLGTRSGPPCTEGLTEALAIGDVAVHIYGKREVRPRRKMGHVTATGSSPVETRARAERAAGLIRL